MRQLACVWKRGDGVSLNLLLEIMSVRALGKREVLGLLSRSSAFNY